MRYNSCRDMKRLRRIIFNGFILLSLLLCFGAVSFWIRGQWIEDEIWHYGRSENIGVSVGGGGAMFMLRTTPLSGHFRWRFGLPEWEVSHYSPPRKLTYFDAFYGGSCPHFAGFAW